MTSIRGAENVKRITAIPQRTRYSWSLPGYPMPRAGAMTTRRKIIWWFKFVVSGRFLEIFLNLRSRRP
jgi:hypothetical protein